MEILYINRNTDHYIRLVFLTLKKEKLSSHIWHVLMNGSARSMHVICDTYAISNKLQNKSARLNGQFFFSSVFLYGKADGFLSVCVLYMHTSTLHVNDLFNLIDLF